MKENVLARRYARALFEIARDREILEIIRKEVQFFDENLRANGDFRLFLHSKKISKSLLYTWENSTHQSFFN